MPRFDPLCLGIRTILTMPWRMQKPGCSSTAKTPRVILRSCPSPTPQRWC